jgi:hypothetical protein
MLTASIIRATSNSPDGRAMAQEVSLRSLTADAMAHVRDMGFVVDSVALEQVFLRVLRFYAVSIIPPWLSILIYHLRGE